MTTARRPLRHDAVWTSTTGKIPAAMLGTGAIDHRVKEFAVGRPRHK